MPIRSRFTKPVEGADVLAQWQAEWKATTRAEIVKEIGDALLTALQNIGYERVLKVPSPKPLPAVIERVKPKRRKRARTKAHTFRPNSDIAAVFDTIRNHPGNRGFQILALLAMTGRVINERTLRTALRRLRDRGYIEQRNGETWFPTKEHEKQTGQ